MLSVRHLGLVFATFCGLFLVLCIPPALLFSVMGSGNPVTYRHISGSIRHVEFKGLALAGVYLGDGYFEPDLLDVLTGTLGGTLAFSGGLRDGSMTFRMRNEEEMEISQFSTVARASLQTPFGDLDGDVDLRVSQMDLSLLVGCSSGQVDVQTSAFDAVFENMGFQAVRFAGAGSCGPDGVIRVTLDAQKQNIGFMVNVDVPSLQNWSRPEAQVKFSVQAINGEQIPKVLMTQLVAKGMQPSDGGYAIEFPVRLGGITGGYR